VAFKPDVDDARNSPAERIIELLLRRGAEVVYSDPHVPRYRVGGDVFYPNERWLEHVDLTDQALAESDCVVILANHRSVDYAQVLRNASIVVDTRNATQGLDGPAHVVRVGAPQ
jgi:UDP-N-acetyl-D-glucosamine dehydrogenase